MNSTKIKNLEMKILVRILGLILFISFGNTRINAQQIAYSSPLLETHSYWNPATTAYGTKMSTDGFFRGQWLGFDGAPLTGLASFQYPFVDYNMSAGGVLLFDKTGPIRNMGIQLNYAYKLKMGRESQLSLGLSGSFTQFSINTANELYNDSGDIILSLADQSTFYPSVGAGVFYVSTLEEYRSSQFYCGLAFSQAIAGQVGLDSINLKRNNHINGVLGVKIYGNSSYVEPSIQLNYVAPQVIDGIFTLKYEMENTFWTGLSYSTVNDIGVQGGIILDRFGNRYAKLKLGVLANLLVSESISTFGPGVEFMVSYQYDLD
ncbi:MAG TPA: PorP/SprF family type IX secretion system membrane protein [Saprospiraceae bacterium]|nr:PorP/SprF family type IX secretion system membrane protein [Saprospiraceae bacterium]